MPSASLADLAGHVKCYQNEVVQKPILQLLKTLWNSFVQLTKYKLVEGGVERKLRIVLSASIYSSFWCLNSKIYVVALEHIGKGGHAQILSGIENLGEKKSRWEHAIARF